MTIRVIYGLICVLFFASTSFAAQCVWVQGKGEVVAENFTPAEARGLAVRQARYEAIEKVVGVQVAGATLVKDFSFAGDFVKSMSRGFIKEEKIIRWEQDKHQTSEQSPPVPIIRVFLEACVEPARLLKDKGFQVRANINKPVFYEGEKAVLEIVSSRKAFVNIFNLTADDRVLYYHQPPHIIMPMLLEPGEKVTFPPRGVSLEMSVLPAYKKATEAFIVVASSLNINMPLIFNGRTEFSLTEFYNGILSGEGDMAEEMVIYSVEKKGSQE